MYWMSIQSWLGRQALTDRADHKSVSRSADTLSSPITISTSLELPTTQSMVVGSAGDKEPLGCPAPIALRSLKGSPPSYGHIPYTCDAPKPPLLTWSSNCWYTTSLFHSCQPGLYLWTWSKLFFSSDFKVDSSTAASVWCGETLWLLWLYGFKLSIGCATIYKMTWLQPYLFLIQCRPDFVWSLDLSPG